MSKVVRLTVHKNTADKRRRKQTRDNLVGAAKSIARDFVPDGFALVAYRHTDDGSTEYDVRYSGRNGLEVRQMPDAVRSALDYEINRS